MTLYQVYVTPGRPELRFTAASRGHASPTALSSVDPPLSNSPPDAQLASMFTLIQYVKDAFQETRTAGLIPQ
jgi:hypothetical protein